MFPGRVIKVNMTFNIIFCFHQLDVCTSCKLLSECLNIDALKNVTKYFVKKGSSVGPDIPEDI